MLYPPPLPVVRVRRCHLRVFKLLAESVAAGPNSSSCAASSLQTLGLVPAADMPARILPRGPALALSHPANLCFSNPCQNRGEGMSMGLEQNKCDCTRTGFYGENCSTPKFLARMKLLLKPTASTVCSVLTHFKGFWNIVSNISFLRNSVMRYVLPARSHLIDSPPTYKVHTTPTKTEKPSPTSPATSEPLFL